MQTKVNIYDLNEEKIIDLEYDLSIFDNTNKTAIFCKIKNDENLKKYDVYICEYVSSFDLTKTFFELKDKYENIINISRLLCDYLEDF